MAEKLGIGFIGLRMGGGQLRQVAGMKDARIAGICDLDEAVVANLQREFNVPLATTDYRELVAHPEVDIVSVATPDYLHLEQTLAAFENGKHVMVEKPMGRTVEECAQMVAAQRAAGTQMMVAHVARFYNFFRQVKRWCGDGTLGDPYHIYTSYIHNYEQIPGFDGWRFDPEKRHQLIGGGCHGLDLARWVGGEVAEVHCYANHMNIPVLKTDDHFNINLKFVSGAVGHVTASFGCQRPYSIDLQVWGTKGTVVANNVDDVAQVCLRQTDRNKWMEFPAGRETKGLATEFQEFIHAIQAGKTPESDGVSGARTVALGWAAIESAKEGRSVVPRTEF
ncbi:MAG: Gfo/Idh/MocA family oxidoreductase [bacterium]|nr:Gfo/Idh/MocA family oxidoreductase [bacterium]